MASKKIALASRDPIALLPETTSEFDRMFETPGWPSFGVPLVRARPAAEAKVRRDEFHEAETAAKAGG